MYTPTVNVEIKEAMHQYWNYAILGYFSVCEIIIKHNFTRVCEIDNKQRLENKLCKVKLDWPSIATAEKYKVAIKYEEKSLPNNDSVACHLLTLH